MSRRPVLPALALGALLGLAAAPASAQGIFVGMQKSLDSVFSTVSTTTTYASGLTTKSTTSNIYPSLFLNTDFLIYPTLRLNAGGVFEVNRVATSGGGGSTISRNRPYVLLRSTNPILSPGFGYFRREDRSSAAGSSSVKLVNDEYAGYLKWNPAGGPQSDFQYIRTHTFDGTRSVQDATRNFVTLMSSYTRGSLTAHYRGAYLTSDDRVQRLESRQGSQSGRVSYAGTSLNKRLVWNGTYNISHQDFTTVAGRGGEVGFPLTPVAGLSALGEIPATAKLTPNAVLIDGNLTASAGVNIGVVAPPADQQARNMGLDFLDPTEVNRLLIWVDRELPPEIANAFSWEIFSSLDNVTWRREAAVTVAPFGPFENRFQVDFASVTARYLKAVVRPLSPAVQGASRFPDIFVTEVQPFLRRRAASVSQSVSRTTNLVNADARLRILDAPALYYEAFFMFSGPNAGGRSTRTLSNGVSVNHTFARIFSAYGRAALEQGTEARGERTATVTNATLTVEPIPTFRSSVLYSGQVERLDRLPAERQGVMIQNSAQVYRGVDVMAGIGWNFNRRESGEVSHDRLLNASATVVPRRHVSLTLSYDGLTTRYSGLLAGKADTHVRRVYGALALDPIPTFHLVVGQEVAAISGERTRTSFDVGLNWTPLPGGALQFIVATNQSMRPLEFGQYRNALASVRWNMSRRSYVDVSYQKSRTEFVDQTTTSRMTTVVLKLFL